ncbi:50S ribosomal protein L4 [candidate division KSB1 bacterium]|nr:50S ribosomal protein L4 [candidate division KSB1 bacterium]
MKLDVYKIDGTPTGVKENLPADIFGVDPNDHAIWQAVTAEQKNNRQGTSKAKNRSDVRGGGRKPWRQKGRGTARAGTIRSPLWVGGGRAFGPSPRDYHMDLPKKLKKLARKSALSYRAKENNIRLVEDFQFEAPKTKQVHDILSAFELTEKNVLLLTAEGSRNLWLSGRNIPKLCVRGADSFSTQDVVRAKVLLIQKGAITKIQGVLGT